MFTDKCSKRNAVENISALVITENEGVEKYWEESFSDLLKLGYYTNQRCRTQGSRRITATWQLPVGKEICGLLPDLQTISTFFL